MRLSLVIPVRNEAASIGHTIALFAARLAGEGIDYEIIVVDDGSDDDTAKVIAGCGVRDPRVVLVRNEGPHGFGRAVALGLERFTGGAVLVVMADAPAPRPAAEHGLGRLTVTARPGAPRRPRFGTSPPLAEADG